MPFACRARPARQRSRARPEDQTWTTALKATQLSSLHPINVCSQLALTLFGTTSFSIPLSPSTCGSNQLDVVAYYAWRPLLAGAEEPDARYATAGPKPSMWVGEQGGKSDNRTRKLLANPKPIDRTCAHHNNTFHTNEQGPIRAIPEVSRTERFYLHMHGHYLRLLQTRCGRYHVEPNCVETRYYLASCT